MANIETEIKNFLYAVYGEEVRSALVALAEKLNYEVENNTAAANKAANSANEAADNANKAVESIKDIFVVHVGSEEPTDPNAYLWIKSASNNLLEHAIKKDGTPCIGLNGEVGYTFGWISSDGTFEEDADGPVVTGFIPATSTSKLSFEGNVIWDDMERNVVAYDRNFNFIDSKYFDDGTDGLTWARDEEGNDYPTSIDIGLAFEDVTSEIAFVRFNGAFRYSWEDVVITDGDRVTVLKIKNDDGAWEEVSGKEYVLNEEDKNEIAEKAAELVDVPGSDNNVVHVGSEEPTDSDAYIWVKTGTGNLLEQAINEDGTPFIGSNGEIGYTIGWIDNNGKFNEGDNDFVTGFLPVTSSSKLTFVGKSVWDDMEPNICVYDKDFKFIDFKYFDDGTDGLTRAEDEELNTYPTSIDIGLAFKDIESEIAYVRFNSAYGEYWELTAITTEGSSGNNVLKIKNSDGTWKEVTGETELNSEEWVFGMENGSTVTKQVVVMK